MKLNVDILLLGIIFSGIVFLSCSDKKDSPQPYIGTATPPVDKGWRFETIIAWAEEFNYSGKPDTTKWGYDLGGNGWGNNELEYYTNAASNASVSNGNLNITARKESFNGMNYTSARIVTKNKFDFLYGRIEAKAKLPAGKGTWPAIWMLPTDFAYGNWPNSGEFDIMEHVGYDSNVIHVTAHTAAFNFKQNNQKTGVKTVDDAFTAYHLYRMDWTPYAVRGYVDDVLVLTYVNDGSGSSEWPFDKRFHLLLNVAFGGDWGGAKGIDDSNFPVTMLVDYIHYYKMIDK